MDQYSRRAKLKILGIPDNIDIKDLETTVIDILGGIKVMVSSYDIVACHIIKKALSKISQYNCSVFKKKVGVDKIDSV